MRIRVFLVLFMLVAVLFAGFAVGPVKAPFTLKITDTRITTNTAYQWFHAVSGNIIVWMDNRNGNWDIYMFEFLRDSDVNNDGKVDIKDVAIVAERFGQTVPPAPSYLDINCDGKIDIRDLVSVAKDFGKIDP